MEKRYEKNVDEDIKGYRPLLPMNILSAAGEALP